MSVEVLAKASDNLQARRELRRRGLDFVTPWFSKLLHKTHLTRAVVVGDSKKSWDVLKTLEFIQRNVRNSEPILDLGAFSSEVLCALHKMGFSDLTGIDLNPSLSNMPFSHTIKYVTDDFTSTPFHAESFAAITAISVIEHGCSPSRLFREVSRILRPGGYFVGSTDYWPEKIDTAGILAFGMDWKIFSKVELRNAINEAGKYGLVPTGPLELEASQKTVRYLGKEYTFAWFALKKVDSVAQTCGPRQDSSS